MRLIDAVRQIAQETLGGKSSAGAGGSFFEQGKVASVDGRGILTVECSAGTVQAKPVTDEPLTVGMRVWVSQSSEGYIVHGGVHG